MFLGDHSEDLIIPDDTIASADDRDRRPSFPHPSNHPEHNFLRMGDGKIGACHILETHVGWSSGTEALAAGGLGGDDRRAGRAWTGASTSCTFRIARMVNHGQPDAVRRRVRRRPWSGILVTDFGDISTEDPGLGHKRCDRRQLRSESSRRAYISHPHACGCRYPKAGHRQG